MTPVSGAGPRNYAARTRRRELTREKIIERAAALYYRKGITGVGMEEIAAFVPVGKPTLYRHFPTKEELVAECLSTLDERHFQWFVDQLARQDCRDEVPAIAVFDVLDKWINSSAFRGCAFINASVEVGASNPPAQLAVLRHKDRTRTWLRELAELSGVEPGASATTADHLMLLMEGAIITGLVEADSTAAQRAKEAARILIAAADPVGRTGSG